MGEFGDKFRKARESKNLTFDAVANVTKIGARMLQAIENERFDQLPGGVFNKGFIRAYAKHLGLNDQEAITDYLTCLRQAQVDAHEVWDPVQPATTQKTTTQKTNAQKTDPRKTPPATIAPANPPLPYDKPSLNALPPVQVEETHPEEELLRPQLPPAEDVPPPHLPHSETRSGTSWTPIALAVIVVVALATFLWVRHARATHSSPANSAASPAQTSPPPASVPATPVQQPPQPTAPQSATQPPATQNAAGKSPKDTTADNQNSHVVVKSDVTIRTFDNVKTPPPAKAGAPIALVIRATETCWISVVADGQLVTQETLIAPAQTSLRAKSQIVARVGNAAGVSFLLNGKEIPAQGAESEVKTFTFDSAGVHETPN